VGDHSAIEWTDATWNPVAGCTRVSAGCDNCYAATLVAGRLKNRPQYESLAVVTPSGRAAFNGKIRLLPERLEQPLRWRRPRRIFVNSMSDLFHEDVPFDYIDRVFAVMAMAPQHTFQVLTKRPERMLAYMDKGVANRVDLAVMRCFQGWSPDAIDRARAMPLPNVWLGTSTENQEQWDARVALLGQVPAAVRFVSAEPLLGPIDCGNAFDQPPDDSPYRPIDWVIVGGESGRGARPMDVAWARSIVEQCRGAVVPVFVKQMGRWVLGDHVGFHVNHWLLEDGRGFVPPVFGPAAVARPATAIGFSLWDAKGGVPTEWAFDLQVREMPRVTESVTPAGAVTPEGV